MMANEVVERVGRALADALGDGFDNAHVDKPEWIATRGEKAGRFRDVNEPRQADYLEAARAAILALREPTDDMLDAAHEPARKAVSAFAEDRVFVSSAFSEPIYRAMIDAAAGKE